MYYGVIKNYVTQAAGEMATIRDRKAQTASEAQQYIGQLKTAPASRKNMLYYQIGSLYYGKRLHAAALEHYRKFDVSQSSEMIPADLVLFNVFMCYYGLADKKEATRVADAFRQQYPNSSYFSSLQSMMGMFPE
jgi:outer membrane protein assembly factor BamD (BamD/ComL family)